MALDARFITGLVDGNTVTTWDDRTSFGNDVTQATSGARPTYKTSIQGGSPILRYAGGQGLITAGAVSFPNDEATCIVVVKISVKTSYGSFTCYGSNGAGSWNFGQVAGTGREAFFNGATNTGAGMTPAGTAVGSTTDLSAQGFTVLTGSVTPSDVWTIWGNSVSLDSRSVSFTLAASNSIYVGTRTTVNRMNGDLGMSMIFPTALDDPLRRRMEQAAAFAYKIAI